MLSLLLCLALAADAPKPPNVILILTDDQGYGDIGGHGNPILKTPNLDRLHREGARFTNFHVSPTCAPTRSALLTGRHEFKNGVTHTIFERERLTLKAVTLPDVLRSAGYTTGIFGKWHLGDSAEYLPNKRGYDEYFVHGCGGIGQQFKNATGGDVPGNSYFDPTILHNGTFVKTKGYCTDVFFDKATAWMDGRRKDKKPFFCQITPNAPHGPLLVRPEDEARYAGKVKPPAVAKFYGMIANIDDNVGKLLAKLKEWDVERETLVIFMNDNGGTAGVQVFNAGMRGSKVTPWTGGTRAASFWRWPGTLTAGDRAGLSAHIDVFPTLVELAGAKVPAAAKAQVEGRSLVPLLRNAKAEWADRTLFTHVGRWPRGADPEKFAYDGCAVRTTRWHLVSPKGGDKPAWQLFDMDADPGEKADVAAKNPEVVARMGKEYAAWWKSLPPYLVNETAEGAKESWFAKTYREQTAKK